MKKFFRGVRSVREYFLALFFCVFWPIIAAECTWINRKNPDAGVLAFLAFAGSVCMGGIIYKFHNPLISIIFLVSYIALGLILWRLIRRKPQAIFG